MKKTKVIDVVVEQNGCVKVEGAVMKKEPIWTKSFVSLFLRIYQYLLYFTELVTTLPLYAKTY